MTDFTPTHPAPSIVPQSWECNCGKIEHRSDGRRPAGWSNIDTGSAQFTVCPDCARAISQRGTPSPSPSGERATRAPARRGEGRNTSTSMMTRSGILIDLLDPQPHDFVITDIAVQLARTARFAGATLFYYSVAEHSVHVSRLVPAEHALGALLHDASEAYLGDVISPLKELLPDYRVIEARFEAAIATRFEVELRAPEIKKADVDMVVLEASVLMKPDRAYWGTAEPITGVELGCLAPAQAATQFIARYNEICAGLGLELAA